MNTETFYRDVLDKGFVELVDYMGSDHMILQAARVSTGAKSKGEKRDRGLIRYLYRNKHTSPFEMAEFVFHIKAPIFVARQWLRHRTASVNELSARYREIPSEYYLPETWREQASKNHQGSEGKLDVLNHVEADKEWMKAVDAASEAYGSLLNIGVAREMARMVQPVNIYTEWYWKIDLHNLLHFLNLRMDSHAQWEIQQYAKTMYALVLGTEAFPYTMEIFSQMREVEELTHKILNDDKELEEFPNYLRNFFGSQDS